MSYGFVNEMQSLGIDLQLTEEGLLTLSKVMSDGCPVKFDCHTPVPINCPLHWAGGLNTCETCWKQFLKKFVKKENENVTAIS